MQCERSVQAARGQGEGPQLLVQRASHLAVALLSHSVGNMIRPLVASCTSRRCLTPGCRLVAGISVHSTALAIAPTLAGSIWTVTRRAYIRPLP